MTPQEFQDQLDRVRTYRKLRRCKTDVESAKLNVATWPSGEETGRPIQITIDRGDQGKLVVAGCLTDKEFRGRFLECLDAKLASLQAEMDQL